jgi:WXXGXW repeat (2 copies)
MKKLLALMLLAGGTVFAQVSIGIRIGAPPAPRLLRVRPSNPGSGYVWVDGYWYPKNHRYAWHPGYYTRPPYDGALWMAPRYEGQQFYEGYWSERDRQVQHDHHWDRDKRNRDYRGNQGRGNQR